MNFDQRFMAKLALGVAYCLFGRKTLETEYGKELRKGLWHQEATDDKERSDSSMPQIRGASAWAMKGDTTFGNIVGEEHAVSILIIPSGEGVAININMGKKISGAVMCASLDNLTDAELDYIRDGKVILLYKYLQENVTLSLHTYLAHKLGHSQHPRLTEINDRINSNNGYFKNL